MPGIVLFDKAAGSPGNSIALLKAPFTRIRGHPDIRLRILQRILLTKSETKKMYKKSESDISVYYTTVENRSRAAQLENDETTKRTNTTATTTTKQQQQHKKNNSNIKKKNTLRIGLSFTRTRVKCTLSGALRYAIRSDSKTISKVDNPDVSIRFLQV